jgi:hypothetical protein
LSDADQYAIGAFTEPIKKALRDMRQKGAARFKVGFWRASTSGRVRIPAILFATDAVDGRDNQKHLTPCWDIVSYL